MLSIVMCVYENLHLTQRAVENLRGIDIPIELIVIDNGCTDGTGDWLKSQLVKVITNEENRSIMPAWNQGLGVAQGENILFTCNDMTVHPSGPRKMLKVFALDPEIYCVTTEFTHLNFPPDWWKIAAKKMREPLTYKIVGPPMPPNPPDDQMMGGHFIVSRKGLRAFGRFDESIPIWYSDVDVWCRFRAMGHPVVQCNTLIHHLESQTTGVYASTVDISIAESAERFEKKWGKCADVIADYHANPMPVV